LLQRYRSPAGGDLRCLMVGGTGADRAGEDRVVWYYRIERAPCHPPTVTAAKPPSPYPSPPLAIQIDAAGWVPSTAGDQSRDSRGTRGLWLEKERRSPGRMQGNDGQKWKVGSTVRIQWVSRVDQELRRRGPESEGLPESAAPRWRWAAAFVHGGTADGQGRRDGAGTPQTGRRQTISPGGRVVGSELAE